MITRTEVDRYHAAAKIIELDGVQGYFSCVQKFGRDIAGTALVTWLRAAKLPASSWPNEELNNWVNEILLKEGRLEEDQS